MPAWRSWQTLLPCEQVSYDINLSVRTRLQRVYNEKRLMYREGGGKVQNDVND